MLSTTDIYSHGMSHVYNPSDFYILPKGYQDFLGASLKFKAGTHELHMEEFIFKDKNHMNISHVGRIVTPHNLQNVIAKQIVDENKLIQWN